MLRCKGGLAGRLRGRAPHRDSGVADGAGEAGGAGLAGDAVVAGGSWEADGAWPPPASRRRRGGDNASSRGRADTVRRAGGAGRKRVGVKGNGRL